MIALVFGCFRDLPIYWHRLNGALVHEPAVSVSAWLSLREMLSLLLLGAVG